MEIKCVSLLHVHLNQNGVSTEIPLFRDDRYPMCSKLCNLESPHKSYIYGTYRMLRGTELSNFDEMNRIIISNKECIAKFIAVLHGFEPPPDDMEWLHDSAVQELEWLMEDLEWALGNVTLPDKQLMQYVRTGICDRVRNELIPAFKKYEGSKDVIYGLVHGDLHGDHLLIDDEEQFSGVIDWSDIRFSDVAAEFRYLWAISPEATREVVREYKNLRRDVDGDWKLFDLMVDMHGYVTLSMQAHWMVFLKKTDWQEKYQKHAAVLKGKRDEWEQCVDGIVKHLRTA